MNEKDRAIAGLLACLYYMMGLVDASDNSASYDFVLEEMGKAEMVLFGEEL